jgi:hypothetical protein
MGTSFCTGVRTKDREEREDFLEPEEESETKKSYILKIEESYMLKK